MEEVRTARQGRGAGGAGGWLRLGWGLRTDVCSPPCGPLASAHPPPLAPPTLPSPSEGFTPSCQLLQFQTQLFSSVLRQMESLITFYRLG